MATGLVVSITVTVAVAVFEFPLASVTVKVTVLAPKFVQSKLVCDTVIEAMLQLSELPLLIILEVITA